MMDVKVTLTQKDICKLQDRTEDELTEFVIDLGGFPDVQLGNRHLVAKPIPQNFENEDLPILYQNVYDFA